MALNLGTPWISRLSHPSPNLSKISSVSRNYNNSLLILLLSRYTNEIFALKQLCFSTNPSCSSRLKNFKIKASSSERENGNKENSVSNWLDEEFLNRISGAKDSEEALDMIAEKSQRNGGTVSTSDCCSIITAALYRNNAQLALSIFSSMRSTFDQGVREKGSSVERWKWARPDVGIYASLIRGLAASLRVSDAIRTINDVCRVGVSSGEEVPFGKVVRCPSCMIAIAVAQPQHGIQAGVSQTEVYVIFDAAAGSSG